MLEHREVQEAVHSAVNGNYCIPFECRAALYLVGAYFRKEGVDSEQLIQAITVNETTDGGWIVTTGSQPLMESLNLQVPYVGILESEEYHWLPPFGIKSQTGTSWSYQTKLYACCSLLLHLLFNTRMKFKLHWTKPLLENTKELASCSVNAGTQTVGI
jgi:hypothetical protein